MIFPFHILQVLVVLAVHIPSVFTDVTWNSPAAGDVYIPGDTLQAVWTSAEKVISPSFIICSVDNSTDASKDTDCGTAVWPPVNQNGTEYSISLAVPNITGNGNFYLAMKDDAGTMYDTPNFSLALTKVANTTSNANATSSSGPTEATGTGIEYLPSHPAPTIAAIAVPLSLVAATLLIALLLLLCRMRRSRQRERDKDKESEKVGSQQSSTISFASAADIERAVLALAAARGYGGFGPNPYGPPQPPGGQNLGAAAAAALGMGAFGWAHGYGHAQSTSAVQTDAYTPAPVPQHIASSVACTNGQHDPSAPPHAQASPSHSQHTCCGQKLAPRCQSRCSVRGPPQLPEIRLHASSPPLYVPDSPPPQPPPKQLFPGSPLSQPPRVYEPPYSSQSQSRSGDSRESSDPPGADAHASMSVISDYMQASPALPQGNSYLAATPHDHLAPRVPPASLTRVRSLRRLETIPETGKPLPARPEDGVGTYLYDAVLRAVGR